MEKGNAQCLDSSAIIDILSGSERGRRIKEVLTENIAITSFSVHELLVGSDGKKKVIEDFLEGFDVLSYDAGCAAKSSDIEKSLSRQGRKINIIDIFIASICIKNSKMLVTSDKGFAGIKELDAEIVE